MADPERKQIWFVRTSGAGVTHAVVHWHGAVAAGALMLVLLAGGAVESRLRDQHPVLAFTTMGVLAVVAIALVLVINARTERRR